AADMRDFDPGAISPAELAYVLLGSIYVGSNREFLGHLDRVAEVLPPGGLYLLDSVVWFDLFGGRRRGWTRRRGGITVRMGYRAASRSAASGSSSIRSASLNLLKKPHSVMRRVNSTICASLKCRLRRSNSSSGMRFGCSQAAIAYSTTSLSVSSSSG